jgi:hypothetical protein
LMLSWGSVMVMCLIEKRLIVWRIVMPAENRYI